MDLADKTNQAIKKFEQELGEISRDMSISPVSFQDSVRDMSISPQLVLSKKDISESSDGESSDGESSDGESSDGESSDGESSDGESSDGESSDGESSDGESSDGESSDGESSDGESSDGESSDGESSDQKRVIFNSNEFVDSDDESVDKMEIDIKTIDLEEIEKMYKGIDLIDYIWLKQISRDFPDKVCLLPYWILLNISTETLMFHEYGANELITEEKIRIVLDLCENTTISILFLGLIYPNVFPHGNVLIVHHDSKQVERYEPHGEVSHLTNDVMSNFDIMNKIDGLLYKLFDKWGYTYGLSRMSDVHQLDCKDSMVEDIGYCRMFTGWYAYLRVKYSELTLSQFRCKMSSMLKNKNSIDYIRVYTKDVIENIKKLADKYQIPWVGDLGEISDRFWDTGILHELIKNVTHDMEWMDFTNVSIQ